MYKIQSFSLILLTVITLLSCVPQRKFAELETKYNKLTTDKKHLIPLMMDMKKMF